MVTALGILLGTLYVYFFPGILAFILRHNEASAIMFVNFMIAWSILGWFLVLIWALDVKHAD